MPNFIGYLTARWAKLGGGVEAIRTAILADLRRLKADILRDTASQRIGDSVPRPPRACLDGEEVGQRRAIEAAPASLARR